MAVSRSPRAQVDQLRLLRPQPALALLRASLGEIRRDGVSVAHPERPHVEAHRRRDPEAEIRRWMRRVATPDRGRKISVTAVQRLIEGEVPGPKRSHESSGIVILQLQRRE
jgi:hypothetical protein